MVEAELPLEDARRPLGSVRGEPGRHEAAVRRPGRVDRLRRRPVLEVGEETRGQRARDSERARRAPGVEPSQAGGRGGCAEDPADCGWMEAALVEEPRRGHTDPRHDLVGGHDRSERLATARAARLRHRQRRGAGDDADVRDGVGVCVVEVETVADHRVCEGRVGGRQARSADDCRLLVAAELGHRLAALRRHAQGGRGEPAPQRVEEVQLGRLGDLGRNLVEREPGRPLREPLCGRHLRPSSLRRCRGTRPRPRGRRACRP